ncbi:MAG: undecaprenyl-diphosphatase UppP [Anaerolineae bacterium]
MGTEMTWLLWLQGAVLGLVQGATEFIPVSSSGHLVLVPWVFGWGPPGLLFDTMVHWGTLAALIAIFWQDLWAVITGWVQGLRAWDFRSPEARLGWYLVLGTVPGAVLGALLEGFFEGLFASPGAAAGLLLVTGTFLALVERFGEGRRGVREMRAADALWVGLAQAAAIAPGISRSGATIAAGMACGMRRAAAARFSFLLSVPIILGAGLVQLAQLPGASEAVPQLPLMAIGFVTAALSGYVVVQFLLRYLQRRPLYPFAFYCWAVGLTVLAALALGL